MVVTLLEGIERDGPRLAQLGERDPVRPVPSCPGWLVRDLSNHLDETCRETLRTIGAKGEGVGLAPALEALSRSGVDPDDDRLRGMAEESALHLWDGQNAFEEAEPVEAGLACLGVDGYFELAAPGILQYRKIPAGQGETLHLHRSDGPGEWLVVLAQLPRVSHEHGPADVTITGSASDLFLCLWGRVEPPTMTGDIDVFTRFREASKH
jgi:hypothetical protein